MSDDKNQDMTAAAMREDAPPPFYLSNCDPGDESDGSSAEAQSEQPPLAA